MKLYLPTLTKRGKWNQKQRNFAVGDVVLVVDPNQPRGQWKIGRVMEVYPVLDQLVRVAKIKTDVGIYTRPILRLCLLEPAGEDQPQN